MGISFALQENNSFKKGSNCFPNPQNSNDLTFLSINAKLALNSLKNCQILTAVTSICFIKCIPKLSCCGGWCFLSDWGWPSGDPILVWCRTGQILARAGGEYNFWGNKFYSYKYPAGHTLPPERERSENIAEMFAWKWKVRNKRGIRVFSCQK